MSKAFYPVVNGTTRKGKKLYCVDGGVHRKIKKGYQVVSGVHRLFFSGEPKLSELTWEEIAAIAASGEAAAKWKIGDTKTEALNGTSYTFRIIGFDHDDLNSTDAMYGDSSYNGGKKKAAITFEMSAIFDTAYYMNSPDTNAGGWDGSYMRSTVMPMMNGFMTTELKNVLRTVSKLTSAGSTSTTIKTSEDQLFLLSEVEVFGTKNYSVAGEGSQYAYYKAGNTKIKKKGSIAYSWWLRSPFYNSSYSFLYVIPGGNPSSYSSSNIIGVSFAFCI